MKWFGNNKEQKTDNFMNLSDETIEEIVCADRRSKTEQYINRIQECFKLFDEDTLGKCRGYLNTFELAKRDDIVKVVYDWDDSNKATPIGIINMSQIEPVFDACYIVAEPNRSTKETFFSDCIRDLKIDFNIYDFDIFRQFKEDLVVNRYGTHSVRIYRTKNRTYLRGNYEGTSFYTIKNPKTVMKCCDEIRDCLAFNSENSEENTQGASKIIDVKILSNNISHDCREILSVFPVL